MDAQFREARDRAKRTIESKWLELAQLRTLGWAGPIEAVEVKFPFARASIGDLVGRIPSHLPVFIFASRESPPQEIELAIPYRDHSGDRYNCRLVVAAQKLSSSRITLLNDFAQALWFALDQGMLPPPTAGNALQETLATWTGEELFRI